MSRDLSGRRPISYTSRIDDSETSTLEDIFATDRSRVTDIASIIELDATSNIITLAKPSQIRHPEHSQA